MSHYPKPVSLLRVCRVGQAQQQNIIQLVDKILALKKLDPEADTTAPEQQIDHLVYGLYGLTAEEIAAVEASAGPR